jgi:hypothetical protein
MIPRARLPLVCVYALLTVTGIVSLWAPVHSVQDVVGLNLLVAVWGCFFFVGGVTALSALLYRWKVSSSIGLWYIEIAGICLLASATIMYASVLFTITFAHRNYSIAGAGCLVSGLAVFLIDRAVDARHVAKVEHQIVQEIEMRDREV